MMFKYTKTTKTKRIISKEISIACNKDDKSVIKIEKYIPDIFSNLRKFYKIKKIKINIELIYSRKEFDFKIGWKTPKWLAAAATRNKIYLFSSLAIEKESSHKKSEFRKLLTHEFYHVFNGRINKNILMWVDEGVALFLSRQNRNKDFTQEDIDYFVRNYLSKNISLCVFAGRGGYKISYWAIKKIAEKFGKEQLMELIKIDYRKMGCKEEIEKIIGCPMKKFMSI